MALFTSCNYSSRPSGTFKGHDYVDLGLPSGTKWATCNIGADNPQDYGDYFAWGETSSKSSYTDENYSYVDNCLQLPASADVASVRWGDGWNMPTKEQLQELIDYCRWEYRTNGVNGYKVTGSNGNYIFMPTAGCYINSNNSSASYEGCYWSSTFGFYKDMMSTFGDEAWRMFFQEHIAPSMNVYSRRIGASVRPVCQ